MIIALDGMPGVYSVFVPANILGRSISSTRGQSRWRRPGRRCGTGAVTGGGERTEAAASSGWTSIPNADVAFPAEERAPIEWLEGSALYLPFADRSFDLVLPARLIFPRTATRAWEWTVLAPQAA